MANTRDIKNRIKSIGNTKKITKAMEMVAASKMRKAIEAVLKTRSYANLSWATVLNLAQTSKGKGSQDIHPLLAPKNPFAAKARQDKKVAIILITSNRGLCGGFNSAIIKKAMESISKHSANITSRTPLLKGGLGGLISHEFILLGKKGAVVHKNFGFEVAADFPKMDYINEVKEITPIASLIISDYLSGKYDKVLVAYTDFINAVKQVPRVKQLLPIDITAAQEYLGSVGEKPDENQAHDQVNYEYIFEPSPDEVLNEMLPRLIEIQLYQAMLESNAAEQSARRLAMHQATEAAGDMVGELTLSYNKARQAGITAEIAEISAGANALAE